MKPEIKAYFEEHPEQPRPDQRQALLKTATFDRWAMIFYIVGAVWVAYWLLILPDTIAEGKAVPAFLATAAVLVVGWLVSTFIGRRLLPSIGLWALVLPFLTAMVIT